MLKLCSKELPASVVAAFIMAATGYAQTGPGPAAEKNEIAEQTAAPESIHDAEAAARIWNIQRGNDETTASMHKRVGRMLTNMIENSDKLDYDTSYWRLLAFVREVPWNTLTDYRKKWYLEEMPNPRLTDEQRNHVIEKLKTTPLYDMSPKEVDLYLSHMRQSEPDLRKRVVALARQNLGQPYAIYLLGEFPREVYDADPMFCLEKGDCVVFSEHIYAMALGHDWPSFYDWLQKIRYKDGVPGMITRNHFTEADWDVNNAWLVDDVTTDLGATTVTEYSEKIDRARFFRNFGVGQDIPVQHLEDEYIPAEAISSVLDKLQDGDFVNIVRGVGKGVWVGHVGLIAHGKDGTVHMIHSTEPESKEQPIMEYVNDNLEKNKGRRKRGAAEFQGMKFLRLKAEDLSQIISSADGAAVLPDDLGTTDSATQ
jgi:hypothetical protein